MFLKTGRLTPANLDGARAALTLGILDAAGKGELNMQRLAILAVQHFDQFYDKLQRRPSSSVDAA